MLNESEYNAIMERIEELLGLVNGDTPKDDKNFIELNVLSELAASYEDVHFKIEPPSLIDVLKQRLQEMNLSQAQAAKIINIPPSRFSQYLAGKAEPTLKIAREMTIKFHIEPAIILGVNTNEIIATV